MKLSLVIGLAATQRLAVIFLIFLLPNFSQVVSEYPAPERTYEVGLLSFKMDFVDHQENLHTFDAAVWYPTNDSVSVYTYSNGVKSYLAADGALAQSDSTYPLIIFNHGFNATEMQSLYLKEALTSEGYIIASVHFDDDIWSGFFDFLDLSNYQTSDNISGYLHDVYENYFDTYRLPVAEALLDYMLNENNRTDSLFYGGIDTEAIGMGGHSFGGLTTLGLIGSHSDLAQEDSRIKAVLLLSSPSFPFEEHIGNIHMPIMAMRGDLDILLNRPEDAFWYLNNEVNPPYYDLVVRNADHFTFSETDAGLGWVPAGIAEDERLMVINQYALAFFNLYLKNDTSAITLLSQSSPALVSYNYEIAP